MKLAIRCLITFSLVFTTVIEFFGQTIDRNPGHLEYEHYTVAGGFPGIFTKQSVQDKKGFIWIATWEGLIRFDGYNFKRYQPDTVDLGNNKIQRLYLDSQGNVLCPGQNILRKFDPKSEEFTTIEHRIGGEKEKPIILDILEDDYGNIWIATQRNGVRIILKNTVNKNDSILSIRSLEKAGQRDSVLNILNSIETEGLVQISQVGDNANEKKQFQIHKEQDFLLSFFGEYTPKGSWTDVGWLENEKGDTVWIPDFHKTTSVRGSHFVRFGIDQICLSPGSYTLKFRSNASFSYDYISKDNYSYGQAWGIKLIPVRENDHKQKHLEPFQKLIETQKSGKWLSHDFVMSLYKDGKGKIYLATGEGLDIFSTQKYGQEVEGFIYPYVKHIQFEKDSTGKIASLQVLKVTGAKEGKIWITGYNPSLDKGKVFILELFDPKTSSFKRISNSASIKPKVSNTGWLHYLNDIITDDNGGIWLSGSHGGLYHIPRAHIDIPPKDSLKTDTFFYQFDPNVIGPLIHDLMVDRNNNIWISTNENSLYKLRARSRNLNYVELPSGEGEEKKLTGPIYADSESKIWISTSDGKHLFCYDTKANEFIPLSVGENKFLFGKMEDAKGNIWFGTTKGHIARYNKGNQQIVYFKIATNGYSHPHFENANGQIWVSDMRSNIFLFNPDENKLTPIPSYSDTTKLGLWDGLTFIYPTDSAIWIGYGAGGLGKLYPQRINGRDTFQFTEYLTNYRTVSFAKDAKGRLWVGTNIYGLLLFDEQKGIIKNFTTKNGLLNNNVHGLFADNQNRLWIHSLKGLQSLDLKEDTLMNIKFIRDLTAGAKRGSTYLDAKGQFYVSGRKGIYYFNLDSITIDPVAPEMVLTNFLIDNKQIFPGKSSVLSSSITYANTVKLKYNQNTIAIEYAGINYDNPKEHLYAYRLIGLNDQWIHVGKERTARFNKLKPGIYTFQVKAANADGIWASQPAELQIIIFPPWYWATWSKSIYFLFIIGLIYFAIQFQLNRRLAEAETHRLTELDEFKTKFYTNITHEFRTPLTIISGMADQVLNTPKEWFREGLAMIKRNSEHLLHLVNQMLDLSKLESGNLPINLIQDDIVAYLKYLTESFHSYAETKDLRLHLLTEEEQIEMDFDPEKIQTIFSNLVGNAIKFTPVGGNVYIHIKRRQDENNNPLCLISIADTGLGISEDQLTQIFDRFYKIDDLSTRKGEGTGIGLALTKELVKLVNGKIGVKSQLGKGTEFTIWLPITKVASQDSAMAFVRQSPIASATDNQIDFHIPNTDADDLPLVLLIEDNQDVLKYLASCLHDQYRLETALNGQDGIDKAIEQVPDIIISDVMMPEKDGFEVLNTLKNNERTSHIPIVMLTAKADIKSRIEGLEYGADAYLSKPFNKTELEVHLRKIIALRKTLQLHYQSLISDTITVNKAIMKQDTFLSKVRTSVEKNLKNEKFGILELCKELAISRTQLHRKLKAVTGKSTSHVLRSIRLAKAKTLLEGSDLNVSEVGYEVGFTNISHFTQAFKEEFGMPPSYFKKP